MTAMKGHAFKANKSAARKQRKGPSSEAAAIQRKVKRTFAEQVEAFIERYRPALEALAKR
jgi:hypothetical protein